MGRRSKKPRLVPYIERNNDTVEYQRHRVYGVQDDNVYLQSTQFVSSSPPSPLPPDLPEDAGLDTSGFGSWNELPASKPDFENIEQEVPTVKRKRTAGVSF